ncbi:MAG: universal stress protein [Streptococcaceae bacterium]|jgi:nucleotide-binding universal stress UspA family protein|nr:universal stress protein [Streptococcaceae bacterium]
MNENMEQTYQTILVGIDGSPQANHAFECAIEVARRNNGKVVAVAVIQHYMNDILGYTNANSDILDIEAKEFERILEEIKDYAKSIDFDDVVTEVVFGSPKRLLAELLPEKYDADLIMVGQTGLSNVERIMVGSVSEHVIRHAKCDVLIVTPQKED